MLAFDPPAGVTTAQLLDALDNDGDGRVDALEFFAGLTLVCRGPFEEKAQICFELFDFNLNGSLSAFELSMLLQSAVAGQLCFAGHGVGVIDGIKSHGLVSLVL